MNKEYLPSKIFMTRVAVILIIAVTIFGVSKLVGYFGNSTQKKSSNIEIKNIVQKDTNNNGIADWEEYLWGLDPKKNGESNKEFILAKKKTLSEKNSSLYSENGQLKENEVLSREFFAVIMSLLESGNLTEESIAGVSSALGKKIEPKPIPDIYTKEMLKIKSGTSSDLEYLKAFQKITSDYEDKDLGSELNIVAQGLSQNDAQALYVVRTIASYYRDFGNELVKIPVPERIYEGHLSLANDYERVAQSIEELSQILDDPMVGMRGIINYKKYNDAILSDLQSISDNLE